MTGSPGSSWDRLANESASAGPDWFVDAAPEAGSSPLTWAELIAAEQEAALNAATVPAAPAEDPSDSSSAESSSSRKGGFGSGSGPKSGPKSGFGSGGSGFSGSGLGGKPAVANRKPATSRYGQKGIDPDAPLKKPLSREKLEQRAKNICLYHLGRSMRTRSQLAERLKRKEIPDDIARAVLDRFEDLELLDDSRYAETFVRSRHQERGLAKRALGYELRKRGIDGDVAQEALDTLDEDQEAATARRLVEARLRSTRNLDAQVRIRRLVGLLARKGYSSSIALSVVREALREEGERLDADLADALDAVEPDGFE